MRAITEADLWRGLNGPLMAVLVIDDSTLASDAEIEDAFGCNDTCNFDSTAFDLEKPDSVTNFTNCQDTQL